MPKEVYIYKVDEVDKEPVYAIALDLADVEFDDYDEIEVGVYRLVSKGIVETRNEFVNDKRKK
jgi:hypothetical protein